MATKPEKDYSWTEPESEASVDNPPDYPFNDVKMTLSGHSFEMDDTKGRERIRLQHGGAKTEGKGTFFEMQSNGDMVTKVVKDNYQIIAGTNNVLIKGVCNITIEGDSVVHVKGDKYERIDGDYYKEVRGNYIQTVVGETTLTSLSEMSLNSGNPTSLEPDGSINLRAGDLVYIDSDLQVAGSIGGDMITAITKVNGGTQVTAGPLGFVTEAGGLAVGSPIARPLTVDAAISVNSPLINGGIVKDAVGTMMMMRLQFNSHIHKAPKGVTSTPLRKMI
jgi:hypothetical protein